MRQSKFRKSQIVGILGEGKAGMPAGEVYRKHGVSVPTYYQWKSKYDIPQFRDSFNSPVDLPRCSRQLEHGNILIGKHFTPGKHNDFTIDFGHVGSLK